MIAAPEYPLVVGSFEEGINDFTTPHERTPMFSGPYGKVDVGDVHGVIINHVN